MKEYKIITQKDKWFSGKFDPQKLEDKMNAYAQQGYIMKAAFPSAATRKDVTVIIMERDI